MGGLYVSGRYIVNGVVDTLLKRCMLMVHNGVPSSSISLIVEARTCLVVRSVLAWVVVYREA